MDYNITFRPISDDDQEFSYQVYANSPEELAITGWTDQQKEEFLRMQFHAQYVHYQKHYGDASFDLILVDGEPCGRLFLDRSGDQFCIVDIAVLSSHRRRGIGGKIMRDILAEAGAAGKVVNIHVERNNPAMSLYERLGFKRVEDREVYWYMEWHPTEASHPE